ncbi:MAG: hypothetical protein JWO31_3334, partial [Phycisphaerales bacterium]|nr:hypothetical protein [Phycisphaerales bacterium]
MRKRRVAYGVWTAGVLAGLAAAVTGWPAGAVGRAAETDTRPPAAKDVAGHVPPTTTSEAADPPVAPTAAA